MPGGWRMVQGTGRLRCEAGEVYTVVCLRHVHVRVHPPCVCGWNVAATWPVPVSERSGRRRLHTCTVRSGPSDVQSACPVQWKGAVAIHTAACVSRHLLPGRALALRGVRHDVPKSVVPELHPQ